jgi:hypothetical protein
MPEGHGQTAKDQAGVDGVAHGPTDKSTAVEVQHAGQAQPAFASLYVGDVSNQDLLGSRGRRRFRRPQRPNPFIRREMRLRLCRCPSSWRSRTIRGDP